MTPLMYAAAFGSTEVGQMPTQQCWHNCTLAFPGVPNRGAPFATYEDGADIPEHR